MRVIHDYQGVSIRLTDERLAHILEHPEMEGKAIIGGAQGSGVVMAFGDDCPSDCRQPFEPICR